MLKKAISLTVIAVFSFVVAPAQNNRTVVPANKSSRFSALVIGNNLYPSAPLRNAVNDSRAIGRTLTSLGFRVTPLENASREALDRGVRDFIASLEPGDFALFYFSGHGVEVEGVNYLIPVDFPADADEITAKNRSLSASELQQRMESSGTKVNVLILDACRNNPFRKTRRSLAPRGLMPVLQNAKGTLIAFATSPGKVASDVSEGANNGLFTKHLIAALQNRGLSVDEIFSQIREKVDHESKGDQLPWVSNGIIGKVYFNPGAMPTVASAGSAPQAPTAGKCGTPAELEFWNYAKASKNADLLQSYISRFPGCDFVPLAEFELKKLEGASPPAPTPPTEPVASTAVAVAEPARPGNGSIAEKAYLEGERLQGQGMFEASLKHYDDAIRAEPGFAQAIKDRGMAFLNLGRTSDAMKDFNEAIRLRPEFVGAHVMRASAYVANKQEDLAQKDLKKAASITIDPSLPQAEEEYGFRASAHEQLGNTQKSIDDYSSMIRMKPSAHAFSNRAAAYVRLGNDQKAVDDLGQAIRLDSGKWEYYKARAFAAINLGNHNLAIEDLSAAIRLHQSDEYLYFARGYLYRQKNDAKQALQDCDQSIRIKPTAEAYSCRGFAYALQRDPVSGVNDLNQAISMDSKLSEPFCIRGQIRLVEQQPAQSWAKFAAEDLVQCHRNGGTAQFDVIHVGWGNGNAEGTVYVTKDTVEFHSGGQRRFSYKRSAIFESRINALVLAQEGGFHFKVDDGSKKGLNFDFVPPASIPPFNKQTYANVAAYIIGTK